MNNNREKGMSLIVKTIIRLTSGLALLFGIYLALYNHEVPGGGSAGGIIIAFSFISLILAYGRQDALGKIFKGLYDKPKNKEIAVIATAVLTFLSAAYFFYFFFTGTGIVVGGINADIFIKAGVACAVLSIVMAMEFYGPENKK